MFSKKNVPVAANLNGSASLGRTLAEDIAQNAGVIDISDGEVIELVPAPKSTTVRVVNPDTDAKSVDVTVYHFQEDRLKNTKRDNTYGAGAADADKPVVTYNDGFGGNLINDIIKHSNGGRGLFCREITIIGKDDNGNQTDDAILSMDATIQSYNGIRGTAAPANFDFGEAIRNSAYKNGMVTVKVGVWFNRLTQTSFICKKGYTYDVKYKWAY